MALNCLKITERARFTTTLRWDRPKLEITLNFTHNMLVLLSAESADSTIFKDPEISLE